MLNKKLLSVLLLSVFTFGSAFASADYSSVEDKGYEHCKKDCGDKYTKTAKITDFDKLLVGVSSSPYDSVDGTFFVGGLANSSGEHFQRVVMNRTAQEAEANRMEAVEYFADRFGLNALDSARVIFVGFEMLDGLKYRIIAASEDKVPNSGWKINDGGWVAIVIDPNGYDLKDGRRVPPGTMFAYGDYLIEKSSSNPRDKKNIHFKYRSNQPIIQQADGSFQINCEAFHKKWGEGRIIGAALFRPLANGQYGMNSRVVISFSSFGDQIDAAND